MGNVNYVFTATFLRLVRDYFPMVRYTGSLVNNEVKVDNVKVGDFMEKQVYHLEFAYVATGKSALVNGTVQTFVRYLVATGVLIEGNYIIVKQED